jgi:hypothetical protein
MKSVPIVIPLLLLILVTASTATNVKWTGAQYDPKDRAATAPRSQKYWDKHKIKRPDYAKTDAEVRAERGESSIDSNKRIWMVLAACGMGYAALCVYQTIGNRLGGGQKQRGTGEEERQARLERFEHIGAQAEE